jgi:hypothetical protein
MTKQSHWGLLLCTLAVLSVLAMPPADVPDIASNEMDVAVTLGHPALLRSTILPPHAQANAIAERYPVTVSAMKRGAPGWQIPARAPQRASSQQLLCTFLI